MAICPHCQAEYAPGTDQEFCGECGKTLSDAPTTMELPPDPAGPAADVRNTVVGEGNVVGQSPPDRPLDEPPAPVAGNVRNIVTGEGNIAGQTVNIGVTGEFCAAGDERIGEGRLTFRCRECQRQPVCEKHYDEDRRMCTICIERQTVTCAFCGDRVPKEETFTCSKCRLVAGLDHNDANKNLCTDCSSKWSTVVDAMENDEVVITPDGAVSAMDDVELVDGGFRTKDGRSVATIKENIWYAKPKQWFRIKPKLLRREQQAMQCFYPGMKLATTRQGDLFWQSPVSTWTGNDYEVALRYPSSFPYLPPKAFVVYPKIEQSRHIYEDGHLCLFHKDDRTWQPETTAATVMTWVSLWLHCYEAWQDTGSWPRREHDEVVVSTSY